MYTEEQLGYMELSGKAIRFATPDVTELDAMEITLEPVQDLHGYEYPWSAGGGKQLIDDTQSWTSQYVGISSTFANDMWTITNTSSSGRSGFLPAVALPAGTYYIALEEVTAGVALQVRNVTAGTVLASINTTANSFTLSEDTQVQIVSTGFPVGTSIIKKMWLSKENVGYSPYKNICPITGYTGVNVYVSPTRNPKDGNTYSVTWESEAGTVYGGTLDPVSGKLLATWEKIHLVADDFTGWFDNYNQASASNVLQNKMAYYDQRAVTFICDTFKSSSNYERNRNKGNYATLVGSGSGVGCSSPATSLEEFKTYIPNGIDFVYQLAEPAEYQLDPVTIKTLIGINNIWTDTESTISAGFYYRKEHQPMAMNYDYCWTYPKVYIDKLEARIAALETAAADAKGVPETKTEDVKTEPETTPAETEQPEEEPVTRKGGK